MGVSKTLQPGDPGAALLLRRHGERLVCVRYRLDPTRKKNITTVETIVDGRDARQGYHPINTRRPVPKQQVLVRDDFDETDLRA